MPCQLCSPPNKDILNLYTGDIFTPRNRRQESGEQECPGCCPGSSWGWPGSRGREVVGRRPHPPVSGPMFQMAGGITTFSGDPIRLMHRPVDDVAGRAAGKSPRQGSSAARPGRGRAPNPWQESHGHFSATRKSGHVTRSPQFEVLLILVPNPRVTWATRPHRHLFTDSQSGRDCLARLTRSRRRLIERGCVSAPCRRPSAPG